MASAISRGGSSSVQRLSPEIHEEKLESRPLPAVEERIARVQERFQEKFQSFKKQVGSAIAKNNERLYEIDPHLVGKSRWSEPKGSERNCFEESSWGELFTNIFSYIGSAFSSWWKDGEVAKLQEENKCLKRLGSMKAENFSKDDFLTLSSHKMIGTQIGGLYALKLDEEELRTPFVSQKEHAKLRKQKRRLRSAGMLNHDPRSGTYGSPCNDTRDTLPYDESRIPNRHRRPRKDMEAINARWNAYYKSES